MAYKGGTKAPRPAYKTQETPRVVSTGSVSKPAKLPKWSPKAPRTDTLRRTKATTATY